MCHQATGERPVLTGNKPTTNIAREWNGKLTYGLVAVDLTVVWAWLKEVPALASDAKYV